MVRESQEEVVGVVSVRIDLVLAGGFSLLIWLNGGKNDSEFLAVI